MLATSVPLLQGSPPDSDKQHPEYTDRHKAVFFRPTKGSLMLSKQKGRDHRCHGGATPEQDTAYCDYTDPAEQFRAAMQAAGLPAPKTITPGALHRHGNTWCVFLNDEPQACGCFGNAQNGLVGVWRAPAGG